jgi:dihydrofolate reductase
VSRFDVVVAADRAWGIGKNNAMPWPRLRGDLQHFKRVTSTASEGRINAVIMGRKTWDSLNGKPLAGRRNLVVSRGTPIVPEGVVVARSLAEALDAAADAETTFVIGGAEIYRIALDHPGLRWIYLTRVEATYEVDAQLPDLDDRSLAVDASWTGAEAREEAGVRYRFERLSAPALPELSEETVHALLTNDDGVCSDPDCWLCYSPLRPENLRTLAKNLATAAMLYRAWRLRDEDSNWQPGCNLGRSDV